LKEEINFPGGKEFVRRVLKKTCLNLTSVKNKGSSVMERNYVVAWRATCLRRMRKKT
jgi:hypothetical protein